MSTEVPASHVTLLERPSPAVLTTYRKDGTAVSSPVWFRAAGGNLEVVIAEDDVKLRHLGRHPRCSLLVFEAVPPFRGIRVEGDPTLRRDGVEHARLAIASRYLGEEGGKQFTAARGAGVILTLPLQEARTWDLGPILP
ncbi:pyridoxamine 5'-phosphate oxidase family protein [Homoserinimonas sp. A447]